MLRIVQNSSPGGAKNYFAAADYYTEGHQEFEGIWHGKGAARLGLSGPVERSAWEALCDNRNPQTGKALTLRQKSNRTVGYDFNFHVPKSVSVLYGLTGDQRILDAFRDSVHETMLEMEREMQTRVRIDGKNVNRTTGEMVWGEYVHLTSRPVDGVPDPHLHAHCFVMNATFDSSENRWKAGQFQNIKRDAPYFEAKFHARMARHISDLGLTVERTKPHAWEVRGIPAAALDKFSRRTAQIEALAQEKGITNAAEKSELGARTRERKQKLLTMDQLRGDWWSRLSKDERSGISSAIATIGAEPVIADRQAADHAAKMAIAHCFERRSVVPERTLLAEAIWRGVGAATAETLESAVQDQNILVGEKDGRRLATTRAVLSEEQRLIDFARDGRGACEPLGDGDHIFRREWLNEGQRDAVQHVLKSTDRVILIRGSAGVGKTSMMSEAVAAIQAHGKQVFTFAPSAEASRGVLRQEGFDNAETVARLLKDEKLQEQIRSQVVWIDEASLLGSRTMGQVFDLADRMDARVILSGDRRQHGSVERGAALRLFETEAGLVPAEIKEIQRQTGDYKKAVKALSEHRIEDGFKQLDKLGWIRQVEGDERYELLARDYVQAGREGKSALIVCPTHWECNRVTDEVRSELRNSGRLGTEQSQFRVLDNVNLTQAERADRASYSTGDILIFHQNAAKGFTKGDRLTVGDKPLPLDQAERFTVFRPSLLPLSKNDVIRITHNGTTADGHRLNNGATFQVKGFTATGDIRLSNGWTIGKDFGHIDHGYANTSHSSQGKTVDRVFIGISSASFPAASREGFYVAGSRGRDLCRIYTDDKDALLEAVSDTDMRLSATEFVSGREHRQRGETVRRFDHRKQVERADANRGREELSYER
jgi:conjugative relaxase-like TrwC/TraI family protein